MGDKAKQFLRSDKLVGLLRQQDYYNKAHYVSDPLYGQAADCIERLREALGWYEKQANDCRKITREGDDARYALDRDGGERARAALAGDSHDQ